jgi:uncharacterized integral membrane protein
MTSIFSVFRVLLFIIATGAVVIFFAANRQSVELSLFPLPFSFSIPLFVAPAVMGGLCLILGYLVGVIPQLAARRSLKKEIAQQHEKLTLLQDENSALRSQLFAQNPKGEVIAYHQQAESRVLRPASELFSSTAREGQGA